MGKVLLVDKEVSFYVATDAYKRCYSFNPECSAIGSSRMAFGMEANRGELADLTGGVAVDLPPEWLTSQVTVDDFDALVGFVLTSNELAADEVRMLFTTEGYSPFLETELQRFARAVTSAPVDVSRWFGGQRTNMLEVYRGRASIEAALDVMDKFFGGRPWANLQDPFYEFMQQVRAALGGEE